MMVMDAIAHRPNPADPFPPGFGRELTTGNVEEQLAAERLGREAYRRSHPAAVAEVERQVAKAEARRGGAKVCE